MIAMMIRGHVLNKKGHLIRIFFPLIILYILLVPLYMLVAIAYIIVLLAGDVAKEARSYIEIFFRLPIIINSLKGTIINIENEENNIKIYIN